MRSIVLLVVGAMPGMVVEAVFKSRVDADRSLTEPLTGASAPESQQSGKLRHGQHDFEFDEHGNVKLPENFKSQLPGAQSQTGEGSHAHGKIFSIDPAYYSFSRRFPDLGWHPREYSPRMDKGFYERLFSHYDEKTKVVSLLRLYTMYKYQTSDHIFGGVLESQVKPTLINAHVKTNAFVGHFKGIDAAATLRKHPNLDYHGVLDEQSSKLFAGIVRLVVDEQIEKPYATYTRDYLGVLLRRLKFLPEPEKSHERNYAERVDQESSKP